MILDCQPDLERRTMEERRQQNWRTDRWNGNRKGGYIELIAIDYDDVPKVNGEECRRSETFWDVVGQ